MPIMESKYKISAYHAMLHSVGHNS